MIHNFYYSKKQTRHPAGQILLVYVFYEILRLASLVHACELPTQCSLPILFFHNRAYKYLQEIDTLHY